MDAHSARDANRKFEAEKREKSEVVAREQKQDNFNADMKALNQEALSEAKKSNEIAKQGIQIAKNSKCLSEWAIVVAIVAIIVSVVLHFC